MGLHRLALAQMLCLLHIEWLYKTPIVCKYDILTILAHWYGPYANLIVT